MKSCLLTWMWYNAILGGALLLLGCATAAIPKSPVRRLRLLEWTLVAALAAPLLASITLPWQWSLRWLPPEPATTATRATDQLASELPQNAEADASQGTPVDALVSDVNSSRVAAGSPPAAATFRSSLGWREALLAVHGGALLLLAGWWLLGTMVLAWLWSQARLVQSELRSPAPDTGGIVEVRCHPRVLTPCAFGLKQWRILLPAALTEADRAQGLRFALAHEVAHLKRGDLWTWRLTRFAQATLWFQPAYWWLRWQVRLCQDYLADADAARCGGAADFAAFLVDAARTEQTLLAGAALPLSSGALDLARRIAMLLNSPAPLERRCPRWIQAATALVVGTLLAAATVIRLQAQPTTPPKDQTSMTLTKAKENGITYRCRVVTYGTDTPIAGARIVVRRSLVGDPRYGVSKLLGTTEHMTDASGSYSFTLPPEQVAERYLYIELDVSHPEHAAKNGFGYALSMVRKNEQIGGRPFFETTRLHPAKRLTGKLLNPDGRPAGNVHITGFTYPEGDRFADEDMQGSFFKATTDDAGRFSVAITTPGKGAFWFQPADFAPLGVVAPAARGEIGNLQLKPGLRTKGRILDADGKPVAGLRVWAYRRDGESAEVNEFNSRSMAIGGYSREAISDPAGEFQLAPVEAGSYEFRLDCASDAPNKYAGTFLDYRVSIVEDGQVVEFRAVSTVAIRVRNVDASGKPKRGHEFMVSGVLREGSGDWFHTRSDRPESGLCTAQVPRGLKNVQIQFVDNEHGSYRVRRSAGARPEAIREIKVDTLDADLEGIEVIRYVAPIILVKAVDADGKAIPDFKPSARFREPGSTGTGSELRFEKQEDGRWRSMCLVPDMQTTVSAVKPGWKAEPRTLRLAEGAEEEVVIVMARE